MKVKTRMIALKLISKSHTSGFSKAEASSVNFT